MKFTTKADRWICGYCDEVEITVEKNKNGQIFISLRMQSTEEFRMSYNGIQLRFEPIGNGSTFIVFDGRHCPPKPIREMYKDLGGK